MKKWIRKILATAIVALACAFTAILGVNVWNDGVKAGADTLNAYNVGLNMNEYDLRDNGVATGNGEKYLYLAIEGGDSIPYSEDWSVSYTSDSAVKVNGITKSAAMIKTDVKRVALPLKNSVVDYGDLQAGSTITIDGTFTNAEKGSFTVNKATFIYDGYTWTEENSAYTLEYSGTENGAPQSGLYASMAQNDIPFAADWSIWLNPCRDDQFVLTSGGVNTAFRGGLCKYGAADWYVTFNSDNNGLYNSAKDTPLEGDVMTFGGWFYRGTDFIYIENTQYEFKDGVWTDVTPIVAVALNGETVKDDIVFVMPNTETGVISATSDSGNVVAVYETTAVVDGKFVSRSGEEITNCRATFTVEKNVGVRSFYFTREMLVRIGFEDFVMIEGASVRITKDDINGLRFGAEMSAKTYESLKAQNAEFGMVIVPRDYITEGYELTAANLFGANAKYSATATAGAGQTVRKMLLLQDLTPSDSNKDGKYEVCGAITDILTNNLTREFVGLAYVKLGTQYTMASYYADDIENNARSIYYVSQKAIEGEDNASAIQEKYIDAFEAYVKDLGATYNREYTINYITTINGKSTVETETVVAPLNSEINLTAKEISGFKITSASKITSKVYANKDNVFNFYYTVEGAPVFDSVAWYHPELDGSNNYDNTHNDTVAQTMKEAGFTTVVLGGGDYGVKLNSDANIAVTRTIIDMFYRNGIKSIVWTGNWSDTEEYAFETLPDFSNHEGFAGFFAWDEPKPTTAAMNAVAEYADWYKNAYGENAAPFKVNLLPSYSYFKDGDYTSYSAYVKAYCDIVLSKFDGTEYTKYLSVDSYPIKNDGTLRDTFLYDWAVLKAYAMQYDAEMHAVLQGCGFADSSNGTTYNKAPTEEQLRLQLYTALAFGADSISWWSYYPLSVVTNGALNADGSTTEVYDDIKTVNNELATFGSLYKNYDWKGVIMSSPDSGFYGIGADAQYKAYKKVKDESLFSQYLLSASNTSSFSSIAGSGSNHIVSVMEDADGNEAFVAVNYAAVKDNKTLSLTLTGTTLGQYAIYKNGEMQTITIGADGYTLTLAPGEGAFIVEANSEHTVTFKNWDGSVLQEETLTFGSVPEYTGATPTREGWRFTGWTPEIGAISGDTVYTALFEELPKYTITFKNDDETVISSEQYYQGATVVEPATPTKATVEGEYSYAFAGWDYPVTTVGCDATYRATYTKVLIDLTNGEIENGGIDSITNDTNMKSQGSTHSLNIVESISSGNLPYFAITLDKTYDLTNKYMVFDFKNINRNGWLVVFDFVNNDKKLGLWNMLTLNTGIKEDTHTCEDLGNGWLRVYVDLDVLNSSFSGVSKIYATLNASDGSGTLDVNFDNLHFEKKRVYTEADDAISACGLVAVNGGSATIDTSVVSINSVKSAKFNVPASNNGVWWNYDIDLTKVTGSALNMSGKTITFDVKIVGNMTWVGFTVADGNGTYATPNNESYAWMNLTSGWSGFGMSIAAINDGWFRVSFNPDTSFSSAGSNIAKLRFLVNPQDGNEANMYVDNLYLDSVIDLPTEADDYSTSCGLVAVNGGTIAVDVNVVSVFSSNSIKATVPAGNSGVWWNYDLDLTGIHGSALNLSGKAITFDLKIVGSMSLVGFTVADSNGNYAQPDGEGYVWTNLTNGWGADKGWLVTAISDGWFRVSFTADTKFSGCSSDVAKLRFLVNPSTAGEASLYIDNLYVENVLPVDYIGQCGLVAVNGGTIAKDTSDVSKLSTESVKCTVPAGNNDAWWNFDVSLREIAGGTLDLSGQTISFDLKIVGSMGWAGFAVSADGITYSDYAWPNLSDGWNGYGMVIKSIGNGWLRCTVTLDTNFSAYSSAIGVLRFMVHPTDNSESVMYIDNLFLG